MEIHIRRIILFAKDMKLMTDFYEKQIGLKIIEQSDKFVDFDAGTCRLALHKTSVPKPGKTKICFYTENVSETRQELLSRGVNMGKDPGSGEGIKLCDAKDPEGNIIQLSNRV